MMPSMEENVTRPLFAVRRVTPALEPDFTALWTAACVESCAVLAARAASEERVALAFARDDVRAYLAFADGLPVGYILLTCSPLSFLTDSQRVSIEQIFVVPEARRGGAARALLNAAATSADSPAAAPFPGRVPPPPRPTQQTPGRSRRALVDLCAAPPSARRQCIPLHAVRVTRTRPCLTPTLSSLAHRPVPNVLLWTNGERLCGFKWCNRKYF